MDWYVFFKIKIIFSFVFLIIYMYYFIIKNFIYFQEKNKMIIWMNVINFEMGRNIQINRILKRFLENIIDEFDY